MTHPPSPATLSRHLAQVVERLGQASLAGAVLDFLRSVCPLDSALLLGYHPRRRPHLLADALEHPLRRNTARTYVEGAYLLDPFFHRARAAERPELVRLADIVEEDFLSSDYFQTYYRHSGIADEINYLVPVGAGYVIAVCLERAEQSPPFSAGELAAFADWLPLVAAVLRQHWTLGGVDLVQTRGHDTPDVEHERLQGLLYGFGRERLTPREHEVVQRLLRGHSARRIASDLNLSAETVRVHRRNIYDKLDIGSLGELFNLAMLSLIESRSGSGVETARS